jgi:hypothetical protein
MRTAEVRHRTNKPQWLVVILVFRCEFYIIMHWKFLFTRHSHSLSLSDFHAAQRTDQSLVSLTIERLCHYISCHIHDWSVLADFVTLGCNVWYMRGYSCNFQCTEIFTFVVLLYFWSNILSTSDRIQKFHNVNGRLLHSKFCCWIANRRI